MTKSSNRGCRITDREEILLLVTGSCYIGDKVKVIWEMSARIFAGQREMLTMAGFLPGTDDYAVRIGESFAKQGFMDTLAAQLIRVEPGCVEIGFPFSRHLTQQHGFVHAGALAAVVDTAGGFAALSLFDAGDGVLTVEFKINLLAPADGERFVARGQVIRTGRTMTVTKGEVVAIKDGRETVCAVMQQTMLRITGRANVTG